MWNCKHCKKEFDFNTTSEKANHSRWCESNPKRNDTKTLTKAVQESKNRQYGELKEYDVICHSCGDSFVVNEREKLHPKKDKYFCSRSCANSVGGKAKVDKYGNTGYRTICFKHHDKACVVCSESVVVEVHHYDGDHNNNDPKNLVPLCPTHHRYWHSRHRHLIREVVDGYVNNYIGAWDC